MKSGKNGSNGHLARTIQKVGKIAENVKCGAVKSGFYSSGYRVQKAIDSLRECICLLATFDFAHGFTFI